MTDNTEYVKVHRKNYTNCRMCRNPIPESSPYRNQGYCDCIYSLTRHGGMKDTKEIYEPETIETTAEPKTNDGKNNDKKTNDDGEQKIVKCFRCNYVGHVAKDCKTKMCEFCNGRRHTAENCRKNPDNECLKCKRFGHNADNCNSKLCDGCGKIGHTIEDCWDLMECEKCGMKGHPASYCRNNKCEKCQNAGHTSETCRTKTIKCWICKTDGFHRPAACPQQRNCYCSFCGEQGHHSRFCDNEYVMKNNK